MPVTTAPKAPPKKNNQNKIILVVVLAIVGLFVVGGIIGGILLFVVGTKVADKGQEAIQKSQDFVTEIQQYPATYQAANLPEYPKAEVRNLTGKDGNPQDGVVIYLISSDQISEIATYYDANLKQAGWQLDDTQSSSRSSVLSRTYKKGSQAYNLTISVTEDTNARNITISWEEPSS